MPKRQDAIISYDISSDKKRRKAYRCLNQWKLESQYSVFECQLTQKEAEELFLQLIEFIDPKTDKLLLMWVDPYRDSKALTKFAKIGFKQPIWYIAALKTMVFISL